MYVPTIELRMQLPTHAYIQIFSCAERSGKNHEAWQQNLCYSVVSVVGAYIIKSSMRMPRLLLSEKTAISLLAFKNNLINSVSLVNFYTRKLPTFCFNQSAVSDLKLSSNNPLFSAPKFNNFCD